jgi:hypothetical protein
MQLWQQQLLFVFPNKSHRLCLWHIYLNAAKYFSHLINEHPKKFLEAFKSCVYEDRSEEYFKTKWDDLLTKYQFSLRRGCTLYPQFVFSLMPEFTRPLNTSEVSDRDSLRGLYKDSLTYDNPLRLQVKEVITLPNVVMP